MVPTPTEGARTASPAPPGGPQGDLETRAATKPSPLRRDIIESTQPYLGRTFIIFKNPISLGYFRLSKAHALAAKKFDGKRTFNDIIDELRQESNYWKALARQDGLQELMTLGQQLAMGGLLRIHGGSAVARSHHLKKMKRQRAFELGVAKSLYFRKSLFDPDRMLAAMTPWFTWMFNKTFLSMCLILFGVTTFAVLREWDKLTDQTANFFTLENLAVSWLIFFVVKIIHEFGHGISCKHFKGEVHEMGFLFILFTPYLYCNISDSWLTKKSSRAIVASAGIFVELIIACIAAWIWLFTQQGLLNQLAFNTMFLASISTVVFNANPLLKFDGYYIMTDVLEIPNLKQKSTMYISHWAQKNLLGLRNVNLRLASFELSPMFGVYAVASYFYGWFIIYNISLMLFNILEPYGLSFLSRTYVVLFLITTLAIPLYRLMSTASKNEEFATRTIPRLRWLAAIVVGAAVVSWFVPWQDTIKRAAVVEHIQVESIAPRTDAFLREVFVRGGDAVTEGQLLARLEDRNLEAHERDLELQLEAAGVRHRAALMDPDPHIRNSAAAIAKHIGELEEELAGARDKLASLELRAPRDGIVRTPEPENFTGRFFPAGTPVLEVGAIESLRVIVALNEREARRVDAGQPVNMRFRAAPRVKFSGHVANHPVSQLPVFTSPVFANIFGGDVPSVMDRELGAKPTVPHYEAEVILDSVEIPLRPGMLGKAKIYADRTTLGKWIVTRTLDFVDPSVRL